MFSADNQDQIDNYINAHYGKEAPPQEPGKNWESLMEFVKLIQSILVTLLRAGALSWSWMQRKWTEIREQQEEAEEPILD